MKPIQPADAPPHRDHRAASWLWLAALVVALAVAGWFKLGPADWHVPAENTALAEARAWLRGTLDISPLSYETATVNGAHYNVVGLLFTLLSLAGLAVGRIVGEADQFPDWFYTLVVTLPLPIAAFRAFRATGIAAPWSAVMSAHLIVGTAVWPVLAACRNGDVYSICQILSVTGLLIMGGDLLGRRRIWPAGIGFAMACWARQVTCLYAIPLLLIAAIGNETAKPTSPKRTGRVTLALAFSIATMALPLSLNYAKFGNPFETGYVALFQTRNDMSADRPDFRLFALQHLPMHFKAAHLALPTPDLRQGRLYIDAADVNGASIWVTSPILLGVFFTAHRWIRDRRRVLLMAGSLAVMLTVSCYCTTSVMSAGYYRYALDFIPIWLLIIAPHVLGSSGRVWTLLALVWSAVYFNLLVR